MSLTLQNPTNAITEITTFLQQTFHNANKQTAIIAVSGGIDSAVALALISRVLPVEQIHCLFLPYGEQPTADAELIAHHVGISQDNWHEIDIKGIVQTASEALAVSSADTYRLGNLKARARMLAVYDWAKKLDALVVGTENKSEKYLGYFTRFGDEASDIEPIQHLYKTEVRQLAQALELPSVFLNKAPSAELWEDQTDEIELGFSYAIADQVLNEYIGNRKRESEIRIEGIEDSVVQLVIDRVKSQAFKQEVPYKINN